MSLTVELTCDKCGIPEAFNSNLVEMLGDVTAMIKACSESFHNENIYLCKKCRQNYRTYLKENTPSISDFLTDERY